MNNSSNHIDSEILDYIQISLFAYNNIKQINQFGGYDANTNKKLIFYAGKKINNILSINKKTFGPEYDSFNQSIININTNTESDRLDNYINILNNLRSNIISKSDDESFNFFNQYGGAGLEAKIKTITAKLSDKFQALAHAKWAPKPC